MNARDTTPAAAPGAESRLSWSPSAEASRSILGAFAVGGGLIGVVGFSVSFWSVSLAARPYMGWASWSLPVLVDLGIFVLSGLSLFLELHEISSKWIRLIPLALSAFTVYLNVAEQHALFGKAVHAAGPLLWVTVVEIATFTVRRLVGLSSQSAMDKVRASRWLLAPVSTFRLWRRMRLWEITSYRQAVAREYQTAASVALLREWHGPRWRKSAPSAQRLAVKLQAASDRPVADLLTEAASGILAAQTAAAKPTEQDAEARKSTKANRKPVRKSGRKSTADRIAALRANDPEMTQVAVAKKLSLTDRTVRTYWAATAPVEHANGHELTLADAA
jgi:hypothetical protein